MNGRLRELIRLGCAPHLLHSASVLNGGKGGTPAAPDYSGAAREQSAASKEIATQQTWANRPDQFTPWGSTTWQADSGVDPSTGQPITSWSQEQQLNPQLQGALDKQIGLQNQRSDLGSGMIGRVANEFSQPFDWTNLPGMSEGPQVQGTGTYTRGTDAPAFSAERDAYTQAMWDRMAPQHAQAEEAIRSKLANMGLTMGSEAYNRELARLQENQAGERWNAIQAGGQEQQRMNQQLLAQQQQAFGQDLNSNQQNFSQMTTQADYQNKLRQQAIAEQAQARGMSLNEMNAILTGQQVSAPQMPAFQAASAGQAPNLLGAATAQGNFANATPQDDGTGAAIGGIATAAAIAF